MLDQALLDGLLGSDAPDRDEQLRKVERHGKHRRDVAARLRLLLHPLQRAQRDDGHALSARVHPKGIQRGQAGLRGQELVDEDVWDASETWSRRLRRGSKLVTR